MAGGENILDAIYEEDNLDDVDEDVEMVDIEEGELVEHDSEHVSGQSSVGGDNTNEADKKSDSKNRKRRASRKKNKRKKNGSGPNNGFSIDRFVLDTCRRLKEKKSYMVYTAVGCLGVSALSDIINEVDAIQACGGQKTADGKRFRTGGGILWSIIKVREPQAYKEIMKKAKEFESLYSERYNRFLPSREGNSYVRGTGRVEFRTSCPPVASDKKQFKHPNVKQPPMQKKEDSSPGVAFTFVGGHQGNVSDSPLPASQKQDRHEPSRSEEKHVPVHDRLRVPVSYDDDLLGLSADNDATDH